MDEFYEAHQAALYAFLIQLTRHEADSQDIFQGVFLKIAHHPELLQGKKSPRSFLFRMAHNMWIDEIRKRHTRSRLNQTCPVVQLFDTCPSDTEHPFAAELAESLAELPDEQRAVIHLKVWEEMSFREVAEVLNISPNTAASRYRYGLDKLGHLIRPQSQNTTLNRPSS